MKIYFIYYSLMRLIIDHYYLYLKYTIITEMSSNILVIESPTKNFDSPFCSI